MREDQKKEISKEESQKVKKAPHMLDHYLVVPPPSPKVM